MIVRIVASPNPLRSDDAYLLFDIPDAAFIPAARGSAASAPPVGGSGQWKPLLALWAGDAAAFANSLEVRR